MSDDDKELKLTNDQLRNIHRQFALDYVERFDKRVPSNELFNRTAFKFFTEALELADFIRLYPVEAVRLADPETEHPDAHVKIDGKEVEVEVTWARNAGRQRGNEYRRGAASVVNVPQEELERHRADLGPAITAAIENKINHGNERAILVVYAELQIHFDLTAQEEALISSLKQRYRSRFRDISSSARANSTEVHWISARGSHTAATAESRGRA
jgi:hypothetical protein